MPMQPQLKLPHGRSFLSEEAPTVHVGDDLLAGLMPGFWLHVGLHIFKLIQSRLERHSEEW